MPRNCTGSFSAAAIARISAIIGPSPTIFSGTSRSARQACSSVRTPFSSESRAAKTAYPPPPALGGSGESTKFGLMTMRSRGSPWAAKRAAANWLSAM